MRPHILFATIALAPMALSGPLPAQPTAAQAQVNGREVASAVRRLLDEHYVLPEMRPKFDAVLAKAEAAGRYDGISAGELAERLNADLHSVTPDKHLGIMIDPEQSRQLAAAPPHAGADDAPPSADDILQATQINHGISELKILAGNVRYMKYDGFVWAGPKTAEALDTAMRFLHDGDAAILDVRENGGGSPEAVQYLVSHFLPPKRPIVTFYMGGKPAQGLSTLSSLPAGRMVGKPLYVLTSEGTASAAEEFTGHIAGFKIGELIGDTTAGAGYRNEFYPLPQGMIISISVGRAVLASTGKDWEGVGIAPTTKVTPAKALDVAQAHALRRIAASASADEKRAFEARATLLDAKVNPVESALPLAAYAGSYGERSVAVEDGKLAYRRNGGPKLNLVGVGANRFAFEEDPQTYVEFAVAGSSVTGFDLVRSDGSRVVAKRSN